MSDWYGGDPAELLEARAELAALFARPRWHRRAACRGMDPAVFFPVRGQKVAEAREVCAGCPVVVECAEAGEGETYGIWGGLSGRERRRARREAAPAA